MSASERVLVVGAHAADFVWRAGGAVAVHVEAGGQALVVALSYGERGESGELWKEPGQTIENVKRVRQDEASEAAAAIGAGFECFDLGDYPLEVGPSALQRLIALMRDFEPTVILTHTDRDPYNPDHPVAYLAVDKARLLAQGAGVASGFKTIPPARMYLFEPHQPELCGFMPTTFVDITPVYERKKTAMQAMKAQLYLQQYYSERAEHRANHARRAGGGPAIRYAEAFQRVLPQVVPSL